MKQKIDSYFKKPGKWNREQQLLREIILQAGLDEDFKWMHPCYTLNGNNVVLIHAFKDYCALLFFKGVLMSDKKRLLIQQTKNVQDRRQLRFTSAEGIRALRSTILDLVLEAIEIERSGRQVVFKTTREFDIPEEFTSVLSKRRDVKKAFEALTPGRQRAYLLFFSSAKQSATRVRRIEESIPKILAGKGRDD